MREMLRIVRDRHAAGLTTVYCSVVETRGSTPQKPGAVMLVFPDGGQAGTLGGGCVEAEVRRQALSRLDAVEPAVMRFTLDDDYGWDDGLICGGRMTFVAQTLPPSGSIGYYERLAELVDHGGGCTEAVAVDPQRSRLPAGCRVLFDAAGNFSAATSEVGPRPDRAERIADLNDRPRPHFAAG
ncbi:MAG: XdhC family protein, partial [Planctomycetia bacterium]